MTLPSHVIMPQRIRPNLQSHGDGRCESSWRKVRICTADCTAVGWGYPPPASPAAAPAADGGHGGSAEELLGSGVFQKRRGIPCQCREAEQEEVIGNRGIFFTFQNIKLAVSS